VALLVASLILGGSGPYTARLSPRDLRGIRTVAVISALGNSFVFERVTDTPFAALTPPDSKFLEISDWALDPLIAKETTAALARRFTVKTIVFRPADFSTWDYALLKSSALNLNGDPAIDAYVLILRDWHWDEIGHGAHALGGLGFYRRDKPNGRSKFAVFASYRIVVVDALTGDTLASREAVLPNQSLPWLPAGASLWPKTPNDLTDAQRAMLAAYETKLVEATLPHTLAQMNLGPK
jgi:hypothetical protein